MLTGILCKHLNRNIVFFEEKKKCFTYSQWVGDKQSSNKSSWLNFVLPDKHILKYLHVNTVNYTDTQCSRVDQSISISIYYVQMFFVIPLQMSSSWIHLPDRITVFHLEESVL